MMFQRAIAYVRITPGTATGSMAGSTRVTTVLSPAFSHPRSLMGDFDEAVKSLRKVLEQLGLCRWYMARPVALVHLLPQVEGGYTNVELRAFREAALAAGAGETYLLVDHPPLTAHQLLDVKQVLGDRLL